MWRSSSPDYPDALDFDSSTRDVVIIDASTIWLNATEFEYVSVRSFDLTPAAHFTALDAAVLAVCTTSFDQNYSKMTKSCMWYSTMFFLAAHRIAKDRDHLARIKHGRAYNDAGKIGRFEFIDVTNGRLFFQKLECSLDSVLASVQRSLDANETIDADSWRQIIEEEWDESHGGGHLDPVPALVASFQARRTVVHVKIKSDVDARLDAQQKDVDARLDAERKIEDIRGEKRAAELKDAVEAALKYAEDGRAAERAGIAAERAGFAAALKMSQEERMRDQHLFAQEREAWVSERELPGGRGASDAVEGAVLPLERESEE